MRNNKCILIFLLVLFLCMLSSCAERIPENLSFEVLESRVIGMPTYASVCWGNYVINKWNDATYDRITGELVYGLCENLECNQSCIFHKGSMQPKAIKNSIFYFVFEGRVAQKRYYCAKNLLTGEIEVLFEVGYDNITPNNAMFVEDEYVYYTRKYLKDGGNPDLPNDYHSFVCRVSLEGGNSEKVYELRGNSETLRVLTGGMMLTTWEGSFYRIDTTTWEQTKLLSLEEAGFLGVSELQYLDGMLYFQVKPENSLIAAPNGQPTQQLRLIIMNTKTGEWRYLVDVPVLTYRLCDDAVYYSPVEFRQVNDPEIYAPTDPEGAKYLLGSSTLYACDHDGGNVRAVYTDETHTLDFINHYTVLDGVLYGWIFEFDFKANKFGQPFFAEIHFDTGEIIRPTSIVDKRK
ncbi:MAG: hypothetical protein IJW40_06320 [Clostridia bacterium]|nr:hypothetical protein [Clostridia bacterium]